MQQQGEVGIERLCRVAGVSRAGYYRHWRVTAPRIEETELRDAVQRSALKNRKYGHRRITIDLQRMGWPVNKKRILRIMREDNLLCVPKRAFIPPTTDSRHHWRIYPNLARHVLPMAVNQLWVADITYVRLTDEFVYLAVILDAFSRRVVGWSMAPHLKAELALAALEMAIGSRQFVAGSLIHHSDRGVQYACGNYIARLDDAGILPSMSRPGCPYDNAMAESFMRTLKNEEVDGRRYRDLAEAQTSISHFLETVYNHQRLHSALNYCSPAEFEDRQTQMLRGSGHAQTPNQQASITSA
jgi:putative transposase